MPAVSLLFASGERPRADTIAAHARQSSHYSISLDPAEKDASGLGAESVRWMELLVNGLTFDLSGIAPGRSAGDAPRGHNFTTLPGIQSEPLEAILLQPGPHLEGGATMLPVVRALALLAARLTSLPGVQAVAWHPARSWSAPDQFRDVVLRWIEGGVFPSFGLAALVPMPDGGMQSEGMALFAGQELRLEPELIEDRAAGAKIALRLLHWLYENGRLEGPTSLRGPGGEALRLEPSANGRFVRVWRG